MGIISKILTFPFTGPIDGTIWLAEKLLEQAEGEMYDEGKVKASLMELETRLDLGEIDEEAYLDAEDELLKQLREIREFKASKAQQE